MQKELITARIKAVLPDAEIVLSTFDGVHYTAQVRSAGFAGKSRLEQHRLVMNALGDVLGSNEVHALALKTEIME
ncbi:MAG: BolA/IbaG family iron-sulfur metabolism protein [Cardiobacteriaceae bacterium]|nr:BolA/IbaG family iron-sulfur metabolism protein [Cardiobacteriaceae bacterium]